jgi:hypothetical protein
MIENLMTEQEVITECLKMLPGQRRRFDLATMIDPEIVYFSTPVATALERAARPDVRFCIHEDSKGFDITCNPKG